MYAIVLGFQQEVAVRDLVESFLVVQKDNVSLGFVVESFGKVVYGNEQLSITRSPFPEAMLGV